ncbi:MAG: hypothetical protein IJ494_00350 [Bacteroides sp.]|nr:hypothetical protein [Bacteroides sp.]
MKTSKIIWLLSVVLCLASCSNDEENYNFLDTNQVIEVEDFVDVRDGKTYKCVKIGNQIWMAQNLAYYIPTGQLAGCYNWGEAEMDMDALQEELAKAGGELDYDTYFELYDKTYNMGMGDSYIPEEDTDLYDHYYYLQYGYYTVEESLEYLKSDCPKFYEKIYKKIEAMSKSDEEIILERTQEHSDKFANNFDEEEGYFYTLDGAKAAVPEGWRIPSDEDWKKLEATLGMAADLDVMNAWRGTNAGDYLKVGGAAKFNAIYAGCNAWLYNKRTSNYFINKDYSAYFWASDETSTTVTEEGEEGEEAETYVVREGIVRQLSIYHSKIWRGVTRLDGTCYSVRCVKDAN